MRLVFLAPRDELVVDRLRAPLPLGEPALDRGAPHCVLHVVESLVRLDRHRSPRIARIERFTKRRLECMLQPPSVRSPLLKLASKMPAASATTRPLRFARKSSGPSSPSRWPFFLPVEV